MSAEIYSKNFNDMLRQLHQNIQKNRNLIEIRYRLKKRRNRKIIRLEQFFFLKPPHCCGESTYQIVLESVPPFRR